MKFSYEINSYADGRPYINFTLVEENLPEWQEPTDFQVCADATGVELCGVSPDFTTQEQLDELQQVIQWAYRHYLAIKETGKPLNQDELTQELKA